MLRWTAGLALAMAVAATGWAAENVRINEFMAKATHGITNDIDGAFSDWIEIHNAGPDPVDMGGWYLTDSAVLPTKWSFPATNLGPGEFMVVWASDKNRRIPGAPLHTNFKLADEGEYLGLIRPDGVTVASQFAPVFPPQFADVSYGLAEPGATNAYLLSATPGAPNSAATNLVLATVGFSPPRGHYSGLVRLKLLSDPAATTYYTLDGTLPAPTNGFVYTQRIPITNTVTVRAVSYQAGRLPSVPQAHSYIFAAQVPRQTGAGFPPTWGSNAVPAQYAMSTNIVDDPQWSGQLVDALVSLPSVCLAMDVEHLFGTNGIYANPLGDGVEWERPCSMEYFPTDCRPGFGINCGVRIQGALSRDPGFTSKHNFRLLFKQIYGSGRLTAALYPGSPVTEFDTLVLHGTFNDHWVWSGRLAQFERDQWCADTQTAMGGYGAHGNFVHLYLNGLYWGIYNLGERPDASYAAHYLGGERSDYDAFNTDELVDGSTNDWNAMLQIAQAGITNDAALAALSAYLDVPAFVDYLLLQFYVGNDDWPENNWRAAGSIVRGVPFRFFSWDAENTLGLSLYLGAAPPTIDRTGITNGTPGLLYTALRQHPEFRRMFGDQAHRHLFGQGVLTPERALARWDRRAAQIQAGVIPESAKWGDLGYTNYTQNHWLAEQQRVRTEWMPHRTTNFLAQLQAAGLYPTLAAPVASPPDGVVTNAFTVTLSAAAGSIYYTTDGTDPRQPGGSVAPGALLYSAPLLVSDGVVVRSRAYDGGAWSALLESEFLDAQGPLVMMGTITPVCGNVLEISFTGRPLSPHTLEVSSNLPEWVTLTNLLTDESGFCRYLDGGTNSARFYRLRWP